MARTDMEVLRAAVVSAEAAAAAAREAGVAAEAEREAKRLLHIAQTEALRPEQVRRVR